MHLNQDEATMPQEPKIRYLQSKPHYDLLDGLRGTAAITIVVFHFLEFVYPDYSQNFLGHGFLAVDFFFCLSGFVIGYAYDERITKIGPWQFFKARLIRLHPLVLLGSVLGLLGVWIDPFSDIGYDAGQLSLIFIFSVLLVPYPVMPDRGYGLFGLNTPSWSLFFEYVANIVYALWLYKISRQTLFLLWLAAMIWLGWVSYEAGTLIGGWDGKSAWDGAARIAYSFLAGLLVYRSNWLVKNKMGFVGLSILLLLAFIVPYFKWNWLVEVGIVVFYFPLLLTLGVGTKLSEGMRSLCVFFGKISYPLYMTHIPMIWIFGNYYNSHQVDTLRLTFIIILGTAFSLGLAYVIMRLFDTPVRKWLQLKQRRAVMSSSNIDKK
ncbi:MULTISPECIES: acyltransferase family protein [Olivibacter]|jgi:peptidoglycan/LPS O-acetylase OafA/YrhL|uniref:Acyltransferase family protein n=2 Tax=Olivibacter TaxID=376469 RepID=A0ABV6HE46_9SPHI|nr:MULTISPECIES: acyltransferase [Olivibacter]MDM8178081.1 acyltransferase [Olivibacter sp. 47]QEK99384.1 acyltransferase [Olivibacter sp. LS-1]